MLKRNIITRAEHNRTIRSLNDEQDKREVTERLRQLAVRTAEADRKKAAKRKVQRIINRATTIADTDITGYMNEEELNSFYKKLRELQFVLLTLAMILLYMMYREHLTHTKNLESTY